MPFSNLTSKREWINKISSETAHQSRWKEQWRHELKKGDYVDAINFFDTPNCSSQIKQLGGWSKAKIVMVDDKDSILVSFLRCPKNQARKLSRFSDELALQGTYTDDWSWRFDLKEDDIFDCQDDYGTWYRSTCLRTGIYEDTDIDGESVPFIVVGYRYPDPNGQKEDHKGRKCIGFVLPKFDATIQVALPNIQPLNHLTTQYVSVGTGFMEYEVKVSDVDDWVYPSVAIHQWARVRSEQFGGVRFFADVLNEFGKLGGFEVIEALYENIVDGSFKTDIGHILNIQGFLKKTMQLWTRQFSCRFSPKIASLFGKILESENSLILMSSQPESSKDLIASFADLQKRVNTKSKIAENTNSLTLKVGAILLKSENFLKRIQGITMIAERVQAVRRGESQKEVIMKDLINADVFSLIFSQQRFHIQIAQRSVEIIKLYIQQNSFTHDHINMLWDSTLVDETALIEVYRIIQETSTSLSEDLIECFIKKITDSMEPSKVTTREVEFLYRIGKNAFVNSQGRKIAVNGLWQIFMIEKPGYSRSLAKQSRKNYCDLLRNMDSETQHDYIYRSIQIVAFKKGTSIQAIKIMKKIIEMMPKYVNNSYNSYAYQAHQKTQSNFVISTCESHNLIHVLLDDLQNYLSGQAMDEGYTHSKNVSTRLKAIKFILETADDKKVLTADHVERTWSILYLQSQEDSDASLLFDWFSQVLSNQLWCQEHSEVICNLFQNYILNNVQKLFQQGANSNGFQCIQTLFIYINERANNLNVINRFSNNAVAAASSGKSKQKCSFRVNEMPDHLIGMSLMWQFFEASCHRRDNELQKNVIQFLTQIYLSQGQINKDRKQEIYEDFTKQCISRMDVVLEQNQTENAVKYEIIKNTMQILLTFFEECEKKGGTASIRPHSLIEDQVHFIQNLIVTSYIHEKDQPKYIVLNVPSNMTLWELTDYLAKLMNRSPLKIQIKRDVGKLELTTSDYCKSLGQLKLESNEEIMILKTQISLTQVPLINPITGHLVKEAEAIFTNLFNMFSIPANEIPDLDLTISTKSERYMTKQTAFNFLQNAVAQNQRSSSHIAQLQPGDQRIEKLFKENDTDRDELLTLDDFLRFYRIRSLDKSDVVWGNLQVFGYNNELIKDTKGEITYGNDPNLTVDQTSLPRCSIAENTQYLEKLLSLQTDDARSQEQIWRLIKSLKTNSSVYKQILESENLDQLFDPRQPVLKLQYYLQIAKHLLKKETTQNMQPVAKLYSQTRQIVAGGSNYKNEYPSLTQIDTTMNSSVPPLETIDEEAQTAPEIKFKNLGADSHWERPQVAPAGSIIALPAAAPQDQQGESPASQKTSYNQQQISQWKGQITVDNNPFPHYSSESQGQSTWLVQFLAKKGFQALVRLLDHFVSKDMPSSKAQKNCLKHITHIIKVVLIVAFSASSDDSEQVIQLVRKMSHEYAGPNESSLINTQNEYGPIVEQLKLFGISCQVLLDNDPNMIQIQQILKGTFQSILKHQSSSTQEERSIIADCLNILINQLTFNAGYIQVLYSDETYVELLIDHGLLADSLMMRNQFKDTIEYICLNIRHQNLAEQPARFFLRVLRQKLSQICSKANNRNTEQYFALMKQLIQAFYTDMKSRQLSLNEGSRQLIVEALENLNSYQVNEVKSNGQPDSTLVGLLQLINIMISNEPAEILSEQDRKTVLRLLVEQCLFNKPAQDVQIHITKNVDVRSLSQASLNKCHSKESREAAYALFQTVIGANPNPQILESLVRNFWGPIIMKLDKPVNVNQVSPNERGRSPLGFVGLKNLGSICYMNAMMQQFFHVPAFRYCLLAANDSLPPNIVQTPSGRQVDDNNLHQWMRLFGFLELTDRQDYNPEDFTYSFKQDGQPLDVRVQQDAQEFLGNAFDKLERSLKDTPMKYLCQSIFQGQSTNLTICKNCNNINQTDEDFYSLPCSVKDQKNIFESLKNLVGGETISDYKCSACKKTVSIKKQMAIKKLPNTLILHLKRLDFDFNTMQNVKLNDRIEFPNVLSMKDFMLSEVIKDIKKQQPKPEQQKQNQDEDAKEDTEMNAAEETVQTEATVVEEEKEVSESEYEFKLVGVVVHMGQANAGHYISYINIERERDSNIDPEEWIKTERQKWLEFNDSQVKPFDFDQLAYKCFGEQQFRSNNMITSSNYQDESNVTSQSQTNAYMLFYEKRLKSDLSFVLNDKIVDEIKNNTASLVCDGTAIPRALEQVHSCFVYPQLSERVVRESIEPNTKISVPFYQVQKFVSNDIYRQVNLDNQVYMAELQVYDSNFFDTTTQLLQNLVSVVDDYQMLNDVYLVVDKLIFDIVFNSNNSKQLEKLCDILFKLTEKSPVLLSKLLQERILKREKTPGSLLDQPYFEDLIFHRSQEVREIMEYILRRVTSYFCDHLQLQRIRQLSEEQISQLQEGLTWLVQGAFAYLNKSEGFNGQAIIWHKMGAYLNFFYNVLSVPDWLRVMAFKGQNIVRRLVELISKYKDTLGGQQHYNPPIENALKTVCLLVRAQPIIIYLYDLPLESQVGVEEYGQIIEQQGVSPYHKPIIDQPLYLDAQDVKSLFMADKKSKSFWEMSINFSWSQETREELSKLMQHVCYKNYDISKRIAKILISGLNRTQPDDIKPYAICMEYFIAIQDQFQKARIEWLFGIQTIMMSKPKSPMYYNNYSPEIHNIGMSHIEKITDMVYEYHAPMLKQQSSQTEPIFTILYKYRIGGFSDVVIVLLEHLTRAILSDKSEAVLDNLLNTDGPAYTCARYWDWIGPYIQQQISERLDNNSMTDGLQQAYFRILGNLEKINVDFKQKIETQYIRDPYLVWSITSSDDYVTMQHQMKNFHVVMEEFKTQISISTPSPLQQTNDNVQKGVGWSPSFQLVEVQSKAPVIQNPVQKENLPAIKQTFGRGKRQTRNQSKLGTNSRKIYHNKDAGQEAFNYYDDVDDQDKFMSDENDEEDFPPQQLIPKIKVHQTNDQSTDEPRFNNSNEGDRDSYSDQNKFDQEEAIQQDIDYTLIDDLGDKNKDGNTIFDFPPDNPNEDLPSKDLQFDENGTDPIEPASQPQNYQPQQDDTTQLYGNEENKNESSSIDGQKPKKYAAYSIMQLKLRNFSTKAQKCTIMFEKHPDTNFYVPNSEINCLVNMRTDATTTIKLIKLRPSEPWGEISFSFLVDSVDFDGVSRKFEKNWPELRAKRINQSNPVPVPDPPVIVTHEEPLDCLTCGFCTYDNPLTATSCEMCGNSTI